MAKLFMLDCQLDCLDYLADNWYDADLDLETRIGSGIIPSQLNCIAYIFYQDQILKDIVSALLENTCVLSFRFSIKVFMK